MKRVNTVGEMAQMDLPDAELSQTFKLQKKKAVKEV